MFFKYSLMNMKLIFCLVNDNTLRSFQNIFGYLFPAVGGETMQHDTVRLGMA